MLISLTGTQSSGKSTLLRECQKLPFFKDYTFITEVTRRIKRDNNVEINNTAGNYDYTQTLIINDHIKNTQLKNAVLDRCLIDGYIYTNYFGKHDQVIPDIVAYASRSLVKYITAYDIIFYTEPGDVSLVGDGERSTDQAFRNEIIELFEEYISTIEDNDKPRIVRLSGSVEQRLEIIKKTVEEQSKLTTI